MKQIVNRKYAELFTTKKRYSLLMGGRGAGRSTVASQYILAKLMAPEYFRCAIMRFVLSDIRNSSFKEICDRAEEQGLLDKLNINESLMTISYGSNSIHAHAFRKSSGDQKAKLKSLANYNQVWIEEADEVPENDFMQLDDSLRTVKSQINVMFTLNPPPKTHWIIKRWFSLKPSEQPDFYIPECKDEDTLYIRSDWRDNSINIDENTKKRYEEYSVTKPDHYWNMIRGYVPETVRGKIYKDWQVIDSIPHEARLVRRWLDFGYSVDPTSIGDIYEYDGGYILDEIAYQKGLQNFQIAGILTGQKEQALVVADSAEPKSIDDIKMYNIAVIPAVKGADSIRNGIETVQSTRISITKRSVNTIAEYENYAWIEDKDGTRINEPKPGNDHSMDGIRYAIVSLEKPEKQGSVVVARPAKVTGFSRYHG